jgi:hypothetical protein
MTRTGVFGARHGRFCFTGQPWEALTERHEKPVETRADFKASITAMIRGAGRKPPTGRAQTRC